MKYTHFKIENFKGIGDIKIELDKSPEMDVYTLVGLNESGKTTILEAINFFDYKQETLDALDLPRYNIQDVHDLIPISKRENFNGDINITVGLSLDQNDEKSIKRHIFKEHNLRLAHPINKIEICYTSTFRNSKFTEQQFFWTINISGTKGNQRAPRSYDAESPEWNSVTDHIITLIPTILYFPNFLFDFPTRIYLEDYSGVAEIEKHKFYRTVIQDILDSLESGTDIETHILTRAKSDDRNDKRHLESLLLSMGRNVTDIVFNAWNKIFGLKVSDKEIIIACDSDASNKYYLEFKLKDSDGFYLISERSLGFRWFFVFLLLTQYRGYRRKGPKNVLFLLDEPASNLHATAQSQLLSSLDKLTQNSKVIYTTHSHYLINPEWLEGAFVVKNEGLDYEHDISAYSAKKTNIVIDRYRSFAVKHPDQKSYFQPILDILDYCPSKLETVPNIVMVEGKEDFYTLNYFSKIILIPNTSLRLLPGSGAGSLDNIIRLYIGWGLNFIILLDADNEGIVQRRRYIDKFGIIVEKRIFSLEDVDQAWSNFGLEKLILEIEKLNFQRTAYPESVKYNKTHFHRSIQENFVRKKVFTFSQETKNNFQKVITFLDMKLKETNELGDL